MWSQLEINDLFGSRRRILIITLRKNNNNVCAALGDNDRNRDRATIEKIRILFSPFVILSL
jgi:hypothetical protein